MVNPEHFGQVRQMPILISRKILIDTYILCAKMHVWQEAAVVVSSGPTIKSSKNVSVQDMWLMDFDIFSIIYLS